LPLIETPDVQTNHERHIHTTLAAKIKQAGYSNPTCLLEKLLGTGDQITIKPNHPIYCQRIDFSQKTQTTAMTITTSENLRHSKKHSFQRRKNALLINLPDSNRASGTPNRYNQTIFLTTISLDRQVPHD
jgi:hypothetical protein